MPKKKNRHVITKKAAQKIHAMRRAHERHGIFLGKDAQREIVGRIRAGKARLLGRQSLRVRGYEIEFAGKMLTVLYDKKRKVLITVLPEGAVWKYAQGAQSSIPAPHVEEGGSLSLLGLHGGAVGDEREGPAIQELLGAGAGEETAHHSLAAAA